MNNLTENNWSSRPRSDHGTFQLHSLGGMQLTTIYVLQRNGFWEDG